MKRPAETIRQAVREHLQAESIGARRFEEKHGLPLHALHGILSRKRPKIPSVDRAAEICAALGLEFYVGPPRGEPVSDPKPPAALPKGARRLEASGAIEQRFTDEALREEIHTLRDTAIAMRGETQALREELARREAATETTLKEVIARLPRPVQDLEDDSALADPTSAKVIEFPDVRDPESVSYRFRMLPKREVKGAAGNGTYVEGELVIGYLAFREDWLLKRGINYKKADIIEVLGKSMEPTLQDGSMILIDHQRTRRLADRVFAVRSDDLLLIKRLVHDNHDWLLVSDNEAYPPVPWPREAVVIGQVMWTGRTL